MQRYPVRPTHRKGLAAEPLAELLRTSFEDVRVEGDGASASFGAIVRIVARPDGRELAIEVTMNPKVPEEVAAETIQRYNRFLEAVTGYSAKERAKRLRKTAAGGE
jgi:hypothetical protein